MMWFIPFLARPTIGFSQDQAATVREQEITVDVVPPVVGGVISVAGGQTDIPISLYYQRALADHSSFSIGPSFEYRGAGSSSSVFNIWADFDVHPFDTGLRGFFLGPQAVFSLEGVFAGENSSSTVGLGAVIGYQLRLANHLNVDAALGVAIGPSFVATTNTYGLSVITRTNLGLGYVW